MLNILKRNIKWRFQNPISILITLVQPLIWLTMYSIAAENSIKNLNVNYTTFIFPGIMILVVFASCSSGGMINFIMKSNGSFYRILISPIKRRYIVFGSVLESILISFLETAILCFISFFFSVRIYPNITRFLIIILLLFVSSFFMSCLSYYISLIMPNEVTYETIMNIVVLSLFFLSSGLFSNENLSGKLSIIVNMNPFTHIINIMRNLMLKKTVPTEDILSIITVLIILCFVTAFLSIKKLKRETI